MKIVVSFHQMIAFGGTETYVLTVAGALERLGHDVLIHTREAGPCAEFARLHGVRVIEEEPALPANCDAVFAQDAITAYTMARRYPQAARIFVAHSTSYPLQNPPQVEDGCDAIVVLNDRLQRRMEQLAWHPHVIRLRQPIDLQRFCFRALNLEHRQPPRVLWLNNYGAHTRRHILERACRKVGFELKFVGEMATPTATPEHQIAGAEVVMSLGRGVLEAMALGRAAYVFGVAGVDGWVTADSYPVLESDGFSGRAFGNPIDFDALVDDLSGWSAEMGEVGRDLACRNHDADEHAVELTQLLEQLHVSRSDPPSAADELARLIRIEWDRNMQARGEAAEAARMRAHVSELRAELAAAETSADEHDAAYEALRAQADLAAAEAVALKAEAASLRGELTLASSRATELMAAMDDLRAELNAADSEITRLRAETAALGGEVSAAATRAVEMQRSMDQLHASKRYRLGSLMAAPLDWFRARRK